MNEYGYFDYYEDEQDERTRVHDIYRGKRLRAFWNFFAYGHKSYAIKWFRLSRAIAIYFGPGEFVIEFKKPAG